MMELLIVIAGIIGLVWFFNRDTSDKNIDYTPPRNRSSSKIFKYKEFSKKSKPKIKFNNSNHKIKTENSKIIKCKSCQQKLRVGKIPAGKSGVVTCPSCNFKNKITVKKNKTTENILNFDGINDAYTGIPINPSKQLYNCGCGVFYHAESYEVIVQENFSQCVACSKTNISAFHSKEDVSINISTPRNHKASVITLVNYRNYLNKVVTFEGEVKKILQSRSGTSYAVMFENKGWTKGFKLVFFRDAVSQYGGSRYIYSLERKKLKVRGLLIKHKTFGYEIIINEKSMIMSVE